MAKEMSRGKQQVLFNYLPNRTFDFEKIAAIARVTSIRGDQRTDLNAQVLLRRITEEVSAWQEDFRPALRDETIQKIDRFIFLEPRSVQSELYPKVLWCQDRDCSRVFDFNHKDHLPRQCPSCRRGRLMQIRFVKIHRCGDLQSLLPPSCQQCGTSDYMSLDTRGSERISNMRWICRRCNTASVLFGGNCRACQWPNLPGQNLRRMDIEVHRAGRTFYAHTTVLLNIPNRRLDAFFNLSQWQGIAAAKFFNLSEVSDCTLTDFGVGAQNYQTDSSVGITKNELEELMHKQASGEWSAEEVVHQMQILREKRQKSQQINSPSAITQNLTTRTGVPWLTWERAGQEMLEAIMPMETGSPSELDIHDSNELAPKIARQLGFSRLALVSDYPIITATYGYSRAEFRPNQCRLNPFPPDPDSGGKYPIFVDEVQADALLITLDPDRVIAWLERNGCQLSIPGGTDENLSRRAYFVQLLGDAQLRETLGEDEREARMVFGLLHTISHLSVRQASLLCGLDRTSLSEYLLPRTLTFALYCNHRFGATIGALTALYEQSLAEWLRAIRDNRRCVYDPVCRDYASNCHACTHLAETSCRYFNLNLSRAFLFGGHDAELGHINFGYFDSTLE